MAGSSSSCSSPQNASPSPVPSAHGSHGAARPLSILLVEDHADSADIFRRILIDLGHHVRLAETFSKACQTCRDARFKYDAILCDIGLPDGDGIDLVPLARELHSTAKLIALTG